MIYAGDPWVQMPIKDLYDTQIMAMSINAAKDMYEKGQKQMEDFYTKYGDFISPIQKDMDWYNKNVTGKAQSLINYLYQNGVDPLRSAEGRAAISQLIYSMPVGDIAKLKQSAETAKEYLKSFDDDTNPELEKFLGRDLSNWSTMDNGVWTASNTAKYQDLNSWTHHLFDDMELSYDPEESKKYPGYLAYTKSRDTMRRIVDTQIAQLINTDLGKYYLNKIESMIPDSFQGNKRYAAIEELKEQIINNNWEQGQVKLESDPYAVARYQNRLRSSAPRGGNNNTNKKLSFNWLNGVFQRGLTNAFGYDPTTGEETALNNIMADQIKFGQTQRRGKFSGPWAAYKAARIDYMNRFVTYEDPMMFAGIVGRKMDNEGSVPLTRSDLANLRTQADVVTSTYGYPYSHIKTNKDSIETKFNTAPVKKYKSDDGTEDSEYQGLRMVPYKDVYTSYQRFGQNGAVDQQWRVAIINTETGQHLGDYWYTVPNTREYNIGIPQITEWVRHSDGSYSIPDDINGNKRGLAKAGINPRVRGWNERASWLTTGMYGVTSQPFNRDVTYNQEGVSLSPYRSVQ